jgi:hypothetical protein
MSIVLTLDLFCIPRAKAHGIQNKSRDSTILMFPQDTGLFIKIFNDLLQTKADVSSADAAGQEPDATSTPVSDASK